MTRDVKRPVSNYSHSLYRWFPYDDMLDLYSTSSSTYISEDSWRDDITPSNHILPTLYRTHRVTVALNRYDKSSTGTYSAWRTDVTPNGFYTYRNRWIGFKPPAGIGTTTIRGAIFDAFPPHLEGAARGALLSKLNSSDLNLGVFLGELPESLRMIANAATAVAGAYNNVRKGNFAKAAASLGVKAKSPLVKTLASQWLALKFGWLPLLTDIYKISQGGIGSGSPGGSNLIRVTADVSSPGAPPSAGSSLVTGTLQYGVNTGCTYVISDHRLAALSRLGLLNPVSIAWELVPMSFVLDWLLPVGNYLNQFSAPIGLTFTGGYQTKYVYGSYKVKEALGSFTGTPPSASVGVAIMSRFPLANFPRPGLIIPSGLNKGKVATLAAILTSRRQ